MKTGYIGFVVTSLLFLLVIGLEIYINGRPETFDWCNGGDYPYSNWYYEYGDFAWNNVDWGELFGTEMLYIELLFFVPWFFYFGSKSRGNSDGLHKSIWLKSLLWMSVIPLIIIFLKLAEHSQRWVIDYDTERDPEARSLVYTCVLTAFVYYINLSLWILVNGIKVISRVLTNGYKKLFSKTANNR